MCGPPNDNEDSTAGNFTPTCFGGQEGRFNAGLHPIQADDRIDFDGAALDFSFEYWIKRLYPDSITNWQTAGSAATGYCFSGYWAQDQSVPAVGPSTTTESAGIQFIGANFQASFNTASTQVAVTGVLPMGWRHVAVNYDRSGNMELFIDGITQGTAAIDTTSIGDGGILELQFCDTGAATTASGKLEVPYLVAGWAHHLTLLTNAQISDSVRRVGFQNLTTTEFAFFANQIQLRTGWTENFTPTVGASPGTWVALADAQNSANMLLIAAEIRYPVRAIDGTTPDTTPEGSYAGMQDLGTKGPKVEAIGIHGNIWPVDAASIDISFSPIIVSDPTWPPSGGPSSVPYA